MILQQLPLAGVGASVRIISALHREFVDELGCGDKVRVTLYRPINEFETHVSDNCACRDEVRKRQGRSVHRALPVEGQS